MGKFMDKMTKDENEKCQELFSLAIYNSACPHSLFESIHWKQAFRRLRPCFQPPNKHLVGGKYLDVHYDKVQMSIEERIEEALCAAISMDGWKNKRSQHIINFVVFVPEPLF